MAAKKDDIINIIVIKKTRDVLIVQEGDVMRKYRFDREWEVKEKKGENVKKSCENKEENQVAQPKYVAQANELTKCEVHIDRLTPREIQKIIGDGKQKGKDRMLQQQMREMTCKYFICFVLS